MVDKGIDPNVRLEKEVTKPIIFSEVKSVTQNKPRLGQGRGGIKQKIKFPISPLLNKPIIQSTEKPVLQQAQNIAQPKTTSKVLVSESFRLDDKFIPVPDYIIPQTRSKDDLNSRTFKRKPYRILVGKFQHKQNLFIGPLLKQLKYPYR